MTGVATGEREVLGLDVAPTESGAFWLAFLRSLVARGVNDVRLVVSDAHSGLKMAINALRVAEASRATLRRRQTELAVLSAPAEPIAPRN